MHLLLSLAVFFMLKCSLPALFVHELYRVMIFIAWLIGFLVLDIRTA